MRLHEENDLLGLEGRFIRDGLVVFKHLLDVEGTILTIPVFGRAVVGEDNSVGCVERNCSRCRTELWIGRKELWVPPADIWGRSKLG